MTISRLRAGLIHLSISAVVALIAVGVVFLLWYPEPLHVAVGVTEIFFIVLGVDVVIGPLLTTVVYRPGKKSLRFDLSTIALLQLLAFSYGIWTVAQGRPVWLVYNADRFDLVQAYQIDQRKIHEATPEYRVASWTGPRWVSASRPESPELRKTITMEAMLAGIDVAQHPELYRPLDEEATSIRERSKPLDELFRHNPQPLVEETLRRWSDADAYLPMMARAYPVTVLINKASAKVVAIVELNPWE
ncbi:MAG: type pilin accessory protein [Proteobacteria bacterium]|nr:type pilin accessory protein [Pseudomonadota bacterium]